MKKFYLLLSMVMGANIGFAQFDGEVGSPNCQAISKDDSNIISWAIGVEVNRGYQGTSTTILASFGKSYMAQGKPDGTSTKAVSLGRQGEAIITFDRPIINGNSYDFAVFENGFNDTYLELAYVEVSSNGIDYFRFPSTSFSSSEGDVHPTKLNNLAGKYKVGWGTPFDLDSIANHPQLDKMNIRFIKLVDVDGGGDLDSHGNIIHEMSSNGPGTGFDLTGICILNGEKPYRIANFEGLLSQANSYEIINSTNGTLDNDGNYRKDYTSNGIVFEALGLWGGSFACGFGPSNLTTTPPTGYYVSAASSGLEGIDSTYLQAYYSDYAGTAEHNIIRMQDNSLFKPLGMYVCNSGASYNYQLAANTYLYIVALGYDSYGNVSDSSYLYLKDVRNGANINVNTWKWLNLSTLGECSKIVIKLRSNDDLGYGMNVPSYFCIDNFVIDTSTTPIIIDIPLSLATLNATNIGIDYATLNASIDIGTETLIRKGFQWRLNTQSTWNEIEISQGNFSYYLNGLISDTLYYYRGFAESLESGIIYGDSLSFSTLASSYINLINDKPISFNVYPNPAKNYINISTKHIEDKYSIILYNIQGKEILRKEFNSVNDNIVDISNLSKGVYLVQIISNNRLSMKKLIIE
ncbi:MAG: DUF4465 domain-containing protein [Bacteroidales bacterium]